MLSDRCPVFCICISTLCLMGTQFPQRDTAPQFSAHACSGQTAKRIKMSLGTEIGRHYIRWGSSSPPPKKKEQRLSPLFGSCLLWPNGRPSQQLLSSCWKMKMNTLTLYGGCYSRLNISRPCSGTKLTGDDCRPAVNLFLAAG